MATNATRTLRHSRALLAVVIFVVTSAEARAEPGDVGAGVDGGPTAGWRDGLFFLRDRSDAFRLYVRGRAQLDAHTYFGDDPAAQALSDEVVFRRLQPGLAGEIEHVISWTLGLAWESAPLTQPPGATEAVRAAAGKPAPRATGLRSIPADAFVDFGPWSMFHVQAGQFDAPFTLDNRTSDEITPFMERSMAARSLGVPRNKAVGAMAWGEPDSRAARYEIGTFLADGTDGGFEDGHDVMGRALLRPGFFFPFTKELEVGASFRWGTRNPRSGAEPVAGFTTAGHFEYWAPIYDGAKGLTEAFPIGAQEGRAIELHWPLTIFRVEPTLEWVEIRDSTREGLADSPAPPALRSGVLEGSAWYLDIGLWLYGKQDLAGTLGSEPPTHADLLTPERPHPLHALEVLYRHEHLSVHYDTERGSGAADPRGVDGRVRANLNGIGANYWWTRHLRLTTDYTFTDFTITAAAHHRPPTFSPRSLHELSFRVAIGL